MRDHPPPSTWGTPTRLLVALLWTACLTGATIRVPDDAPTLQDALARAQAGDTILFAPGQHWIASGLEVDVPLTLASEFITSDDYADVLGTVLAGDIDVEGITFAPGSTGSRIVGLSFSGMWKALIIESQMTVEHNRFFAVESDAVDYEDGGGLCMHNIFENSSDDGIDLDGAVDVIIERNVIRHNADDGIEKRFHARSGDPLVTIIRDNEIYGNGEDGIQLIDYDGDTNRQVWIHHNLIFDNAMAGIGSMADGNTIEDYTGAPLVEALFIHNNTIAGNDHGLVGGTNMVVLNNLFIGNAVGVKRVAGASVVAHALFFDNLEDTVDNGEGVLDVALAFEDPVLDGAFVPQPGSPCTDSGVAQFSWNDTLVLDLPPERYEGLSPNLGARESDAPIVPERGNLPPAVNLGDTRFVLASDLPLTIEPLVVDDGMPGVPLTHAWRAEGPADVDFNDPSGRDVQVSFSRHGRYTLTLTVDDGLLQSVARLVVYVVADHQPDRTTIVGDEPAWIEAERYTALMAPASVVVDATASEGAMVEAIDSGSTLHRLVLTEEDPRYHLWLRVRSSGDGGQLAVTIDARDAAVLQIAYVEDSWAWQRLPAPFEAPAGTYPLQIEAHGGTVRWDALVLTTDPEHVPSDLGGDGDARVADDGGPGDEVAGDGDAGPDTDVSETAVLEARRQIHGSRSGCGCHLTPGAGGTEPWPLSLLALVALAGLRRRVADTGSGFP